ncbi:MAG: NUDIX pyrophosphatase [Christensenellaceae bacterium]|nr:NUDIX pyrophosphatase [Christensenellaceae bacterium]
MARAKYQVLIIPFHIANDKVSYCVFHRSDRDVWQFISGGGEEEDESIMFSAKRESYEEAKIDVNNKFFPLDSMCSIPTHCVKEASKIWGEDWLVIPEYSFAVKLDSLKIHLSDEHTEYTWVDYDTAVKMLTHDSNKTALWELNSKIKLGKIC